MFQLFPSLQGRWRVVFFFFFFSFFPARNTLENLDFYLQLGHSASRGDFRGVAKNQSWEERKTLPVLTFLIQAEIISTC